MNPHSDSLRAKLLFSKDGTNFAARKGGVASMLRHNNVYIEHNRPRLVY